MEKTQTRVTYFLNEYSKLLHDFQNLAKEINSFTVGVLVQTLNPIKDETDNMLTLIRDHTIELQEKCESLQDKPVKEQYETARLIHENLRLIAFRGL